MTDIAQDNRIWWQTVLQVVAATLLFIPVLMMAGFVATLVSALHGEGVGIVFRAMQFGFAAYISLGLPALLLKRSHTIVAASVWCTGVTTVFLVLLAIGIAGGAAATNTFWEWVEIAASVGGIIGGSIGYSLSDYS